MSKKLIPRIIAYYVAPIAKVFLAELVVDLRVSRRHRFLRVYLDCDRRIEVDVYSKHAVIEFTKTGDSFYMLRLHEDADTFTVVEEDSEYKNSFTVRKKTPRVNDLEEIAVEKILDFYMSSDEYEAVIGALTERGVVRLEPCRHGRHIMLRVCARLLIRDHLYIATPWHIYVNRHCQLEINKLPEAQCTLSRIPLDNPDPH